MVTEIHAYLNHAKWRLLALHYHVPRLYWDWEWPSAALTNTHGKEHAKTCWSPLEEWLPEYQTVWPVSVLQKNLGESILPRVGSSWRLVQQRYHPRRAERPWWKLQTSSITRGELGKHRWGGPWRHPEIIGVWRALVKVDLKERPCSGPGEKAREN